MVSASCSVAGNPSRYPRADAEKERRETEPKEQPIDHLPAGEGHGRCPAGKKAKSDQDMLPETAEGLAGRPEATNLVGILATMTGRTTDAVCAEFAGKGFGAFKPAMGELLVETLRPIRTRFMQLRTDDAALDAILEKGAAKARAAAEPTLRAAYDAMGLMR